MRHSLLPYLYSANVRTAYEGIPLVSPAYYYSDSPLAHAKAFRNEYYFGEQLFVSPITSPSKGGVSTQEVWLPSGEWYDFFSGEKFEARDKNGVIFKREYALDEYPVFAKAGAIVPMIENLDDNSQSFESLKIKVFTGKENSFVLYDECENSEKKAENNDDKTAVNRLFERDNKDLEKLASIRFDLKESDGKWTLEITPLANCKTRRINIISTHVKSCALDLTAREKVVVEI